MMQIDSIETALHLAKLPTGFNSTESLLLENVLADTRLIEAVTWDLALYLEDEDIQTSILRQQVIFEAMGLTLRGFNAFRYHSDCLASVEYYISALMYLADLGIDESS